MHGNFRENELYCSKASVYTKYGLKLNANGKLQTLNPERLHSLFHPDGAPRQCNDGRWPYSLTLAHSQTESERVSK